MWGKEYNIYVFINKNKINDINIYENMKNKCILVY